MPSALSDQKVSIGPHDFVAEIAIERPAREVYALLDLADPGNANRQLGDRVEEVPGQAGQFTLTVSELPDAVFALTVTASRPCREYAFASVSSELFGHMARSHEHYAIEELGNAGCRVVLTNSVEFDRPLDEQEFEIESIMLTIASSKALFKLKLHAEEGPEAVKALSDGPDFDFCAGSFNA